MWRVWREKKRAETVGINEPLEVLVSGELIAGANSYKREQKEGGTCTLLEL